MRTVLFSISYLKTFYQRVPSLNTRSPGMVKTFYWLDLMDIPGMLLVFMGYVAEVTSVNWVISGSVLVQMRGGPRQGSWGGEGGFPREQLDRDPLAFIFTQQKSCQLFVDQRGLQWRKESRGQNKITYKTERKIRQGRPWLSRELKESACQCRGLGFDPWSGD